MSSVNPSKIIRPEGCLGDPNLRLVSEMRVVLGTVALTLQPHSMKAEDQLAQQLTKAILDFGCWDF